MTLIKSNPIAFSFSAAEIDRTSATASVIAWSRFEADKLSRELQDETKRIIDKLELNPETTYVICRPEIFLEQESESWLLSRLPGVQNHICFSSGTTLKYVTSLENIFFHYNPYRSNSMALLSKLFRRAPELLSQFTAQINSEYCVTYGATEFRPAPVLIQGTSRRIAVDLRLFPLFLQPGWIDGSVAVMQASLTSFNVSSKGKQAMLFSLTPAALSSSAFVADLALLILRVCFSRSIQLVLLMPNLEFDEPSLDNRLHYFLSVISPHLSDLPRVIFTNIFVSMSDTGSIVASYERGKCDLILHETSAFWRETDVLYQFCNRVYVYGEGQQSGRVPRELYGLAFGSEPVFIESIEHIKMRDE